MVWLYLELYLLKAAYDIIGWTTVFYVGLALGGLMVLLRGVRR